MKKIFVFALTLVMTIMLCACVSGTLTGDEAQAFVDDMIDQAEQVIHDAGLDDVTLDGADEEYLGITNPMTEYGSLDEINEIVGSKLVRSSVMGVTGEKFYTVDCGDFTMADYRFEVNGNPYSLRCAPVADQDISGIYVGNGTAFPDKPGTDDIEFCLESGVQAARWFTMDGQYVLSAEETGKINNDTFKMIAEEFYSITATGMSETELRAFYEELEGRYADKNAPRATVEVVANGSESVSILITWSSSAAVHEEWTMTAKLSEDGLLCYNDLVQKELTYTSDTEYTEEIMEFPTQGWFEYADGVLFWSGAGEDGFSDCAFEKFASI